MKFKGYDHPDNFDISKRPSNAALTRAFCVGAVLSMIPGGVILPMPYVFIASEPSSIIYICLTIVGALIGIAFYLPGNLREGRRKRREFVSAGGDPTGISDRQFGAMGGEKLKDGRWQWSFEGGSGDYV